VQVTPVSYQQEKQVVTDEPMKRKRGRPRFLAGDASFDGVATTATTVFFGDDPDG
ncbi:unnamed protein product, partial [Rotaria sp. Silwood1]